MKSSLTRREDLRDQWLPVARRQPTIRTAAASFRWVLQSALRLALFHKSRAQLSPRAPSPRLASRRAGARECTTVRHEQLSGSSERARLRWRCRQFPSARSTRSHLPHDRKSRSAVAATSVTQTVSLRCYKAYSPPIIKPLTRFLSQFSFAHHPSQHFRWPERFGAKLAMQILGNVQSHIESNEIGQLQRPHRMVVAE